MINKIKKVVIISPHPDDETLGVGGTIARLIESGIDVSILQVSGHLPPLYDRSHFEVTKQEAIKAFSVLGVNSYEFMEIPATQVHNIPVATLNKGITDFIMKNSPEMVLLPFPDRHIDHRTIFDASVVSCRPNRKGAPKFVFAYETLSETHWNVPGIEPHFAPEVFFDISNTLSKKIQALNCYQSQIKNNTSRSVEAVEALAKFRGSQNGFEYAEAFKVVRINV